MVIPKSFMTVLVSSLLLAAFTGPLGAPRAAQAAPASTPIVVDDGSDVTPCSGFYTLRCAIVYANAHSFTSIRFAPGLPAVLLNSPLPTITGAGTWIDGHDLSNGCVCPRLDGAFWSGATGNALTINASYVTISNMRIVNIPSAGEDISIIGGKDIEVSYDDLGILPGATQCPAFASTIGVGVAGDNAGSAGPANGVAYIYGDTISCHGGSGVEVVASNYVYVGMQRDGTTTLGNNIGTTSDGTRAAGNGYDGVRVAVNSDQVTIRANRIAYNANGGVTVAGTHVDVSFNTLSGNFWGLALGGGSTLTIIGNKIGTSADGLTALPNRHEGILISGGDHAFLSDNVVANNGGAGIAVTGNTTQALIENNNISNNGGLPIDLGDDGPTRNGQHFPPGPNNWQAYPVVTAASGSLIQGTACPSCAVYIYRAIGNPAQPRGGGHFLTNTFANGFGQWGVTLPPGVTSADITLTAFNAAGDSSEMSPRPQLLLPLLWR
jgi:parallel beta-helix repeat protein